MEKPAGDDPPAGIFYRINSGMRPVPAFFFNGIRPPSILPVIYPSGPKPSKICICALLSPEMSDKTGVVIAIHPAIVADIRVSDPGR